MFNITSNQTCSIMLGIGALIDAALKPSFNCKWKTHQ